jgi:hypothetical protein
VLLLRGRRLPHPRTPPLGHLLARRQLLLLELLQPRGLLLQLLR